MNSPDAHRLSAQGVSKTYRARGLVDLLPWRGGQGGAELRTALHAIDLVVGSGVSLGIVGRNGAGKSTLLRILSGVATPSSGRIVVSGKRRSLLDLGSGMIEEISGRQNVLMQLGLDGLSPRESEQRWEGILEFSGLGRFAEEPVRTYSSGMRVRLAYAVAIAVPCDVLLADEVLAVGDEEFQRRCSHHVRDFLAGGGSLVLASHNLYHVEKLCRDAIWLEDGRVRERGPARDVTAAYRSWIDATDPAAPEPNVDDTRAESPDPVATKTTLPGAGGSVVPIVVRTYSDGLAMTRVRAGGRFAAKFSRTPPSAAVIEIARPGGSCVLSMPIEGAVVEIGELPILPGRYRLRMRLEDGRLGHLEGDDEIDCVGSSRELGSVRLRHAWLETTPA